MRAKQTTQNFFLTFIFVATLLAMLFLAFQKESLPVEPKGQLIGTDTPAPHFTIHIPQTALLKNYATVSVEAPEGTACNLTLISASGETQAMDATANAEGWCEWRWKLEESYGKENARLIFTINGTSDTHFLEVLAGS